jgi:hypothetical protein
LRLALIESLNKRNAQRSTKLQSNTMKTNKNKNIRRTELHAEFFALIANPQPHRPISTRPLVDLVTQEVVDPARRPFGVSIATAFERVERGSK